jgi:PAS domain S-box-containing protein
MKATEKALLESEKNFRALAENANDAMLITGSNGGYIYANKRANEVTGYSISELTRLSIKDLISPDEFTKINTYYKKRLAGKDVPISYETNIIQKHGKIVPVEVTDAKTVWQGKPAVMGIFRDITERRRLYEDLRIKDSAIESAINAIAFCDPEQTLVYVNRSFLELWGYENIQEVKERPAKEFWKETDRFSEKIRALWKTGSWIGESVARRKDGSGFCAQISASMITDSDGKPVLTMESFIDISEKKQMEAALRESNEELEKRVKERTLKLRNATRELNRKQKEILFHKTELEKVNEELMESNQGLTALAKNIERRKEEAEKRVRETIRFKILPLLETLKKDKTIGSRRADFDLMGAYLHDLTLDAAGQPNPIFTLSLTEMQVATMIKNGFSSKEIASQMGVSLATVKTHRRNIRKKMNIQHSDINLVAYLRSKID